LKEDIKIEREFCHNFFPIFSSLLESFATTWQFRHHGGTLMGQHEPISLNSQLALCVSGKARGHGLH
jgi:hypothetical protein